MTRLRRAVLALVPLAALGFGMVTAAPASAASVGGLGVRPAHNDPNDPATKAYFKPQVAPGGTFSDAVVVSNSSDAPIHVFVSAVDGMTSPSSGAVYANRTDPVVKAAMWVSTPTPTLTVPAHATIEVPFTVHVPSDASAGDHLAGLAVEDADPHSSGGTFSVTEIIRAVVGIQIQVPGAAGFTIEAGKPSLAQLTGTSNAAVTVPLTNTGGLLGKPTLTVGVTGQGYHRDVTRDLDTVLPGDHIAYPFVWPDDLPPGHYDISVHVAAGGLASTVTGRSTLGQSLNGAANPGATKQVIIRAAADGVSMAVVVLAILAALLIAAVAVRARSVWALRAG